MKNTLILMLTLSAGAAFGQVGVNSYARPTHGPRVIHHRPAPVAPIGARIYTTSYATPTMTAVGGMTTGVATHRAYYRGRAVGHHRHAHRHMNCHRRARTCMTHCH